MVMWRFDKIDLNVIKQNLFKNQNGKTLGNSPLQNESEK